MGKYIKTNPKPTGKQQQQQPSLINIPNPGVRTRAKTLALQNAAVSSPASYIQLRSRRLIKPTPTKRHRVPPKSNNNNNNRVRVSSKTSSGSVNKLVDEGFGNDGEGSFGENMLEIEPRGRSTRETTPCNLIRDPDAISTPGSSTKRAYSNNANYRVQTSAPTHIPLTVEMDAFFTEPEKQQQQLFIEKYNFDPVNDKPLPGRYEWVKMDDTKNSS
ncbi:hypothetical protein M8C21_032940 [Ambrosia artemisiifolia]|uniref:Cyclin-dependent kinase inhibitor n=1 Tax=Ambrosia artemisiifolia TaxID=4212 RepID=A0AAD5C468_AMBAR|nr:hypothetical protein M8C21_032940 [Ambrosia artemisiifolia]